VWTTLLLVLLLTLLLILFGKSIYTKLKLIWWHVSIAVNALRMLWTLPKEDMDNFFESYKLFEQEKVGKDDDKYVRNYYKVLNLLCAIGQAQKMYIPPMLDPSKGVFENQYLYEESIAKYIGAKSGQRILDVGCGRGLIALHVARVSGASVYGINIDPTQIESAKGHAAVAGLSKRLSFQVHNYNDPWPFPDNHFDGVYEVQAFTYAKDRMPVFRELYRVMKPGAKFSTLDWYLLDNYDADKPHHVELLKRTKALGGAVSSPTVPEVLRDYEKVGFKVIHHELPSVGGVQYPLIAKADRYYRFAETLVNVLVKLRIIPKHFKSLMERLTKDCDAFAEGDKLGLFTTTYQIVLQKPHGENGTTNGHH